MNRLEITVEEYKELIVKAWKFDQLKKQAEKSSYNTDFEKAIFELEEKTTEEEKDT